MRKLMFVLLSMMLLAVVGCGSAEDASKQGAASASAQLAESSVLNRVVKNGVLRVGMDPGYMPFEMRNKQGNVIGFDVELAEQMAKALGVKLELVPTAWDGIIPALMTDKFDIIMSGMTITAERNLQINFVDPYVVVGQTILVRKGDEAKIKSYKDLNDPKFTVSTKLGTTADFATKKLIPNATLKLFETEAEAVLEVSSGKADAFVYDLPYNAIYFGQNADKLAHIAEPFTYEPLAWAIRKGDPDFLNWLNNWLRQIKGDGTYDEIYARWFKNTDWLATVQ